MHTPERGRRDALRPFERTVEIRRIRESRARRGLGGRTAAQEDHLRRFHPAAGDIFAEAQARPLAEKVGKIAHAHRSGLRRLLDMQLAAIALLDKRHRLIDIRRIRADDRAAVGHRFAVVARQQRQQLQHVGLENDLVEFRPAVVFGEHFLQKPLELHSAQLPRRMAGARAAENRREALDAGIAQQAAPGGVEEVVPGDQLGGEFAADDGEVVAFILQPVFDKRRDHEHVFGAQRIFRALDNMRTGAGDDVPNLHILVRMRLLTPAGRHLVDTHGEIAAERIRIAHFYFFGRLVHDASTALLSPIRMSEAVT